MRVQRTIVRHRGHGNVRGPVSRLLPDHHVALTRTVPGHRWSGVDGHGACLHPRRAYRPEIDLLAGDPGVRLVLHPSRLDPPFPPPSLGRPEHVHHRLVLGIVVIGIPRLPHHEESAAVACHRRLLPLSRHPAKPQHAQVDRGRRNPHRRGCLPRIGGEEGSEDAVAWHHQVLEADDVLSVSSTVPLVTVAIETRSLVIE